MGAQDSQSTNMKSTPPASPATATDETTRPYIPPPTYRKVETFDEKLYRKCTEQPLVPIGAIATAWCLGSGIKSFMNRDIARSQTMMRARVAAQFGTILIFIGYAGASNFQFNWIPEKRDE
mmetsp:Transcript_13978/g.17605  ORF Transcript_13978/g.17605 Transcript_13978/m.17605 type:complete len:121 (+) Transcript_13978:146-508(+)|eukprot:CAMPEP_0172484698 /NCGR_PEP_ID=MMETSP1066-20121228/12268_1 /TAXON_ID=671091 /ORGANISM="Coscinodiscus wailesii, Strain CCMP2513" /LENGTH=120 /DNA_ID=CAMNT_0013249387 /DNA_START=146 /DNA_END=511 /DNA_ORIENTATION=-